MNINEIITNRALQKTGNMCGKYTYIDPTEHANIYQSTNDVIPTALTPHIGYHKAAELAKLMKEKKTDIFEANNILKAIDPSKLESILQPKSAEVGILDQ